VTFGLGEVAREVPEGAGDVAALPERTDAADAVGAAAGL
jgi:hypothetical protein